MTRISGNSRADHQQSSASNLATICGRILPPI
jgi:hypothetical protein